MRTLLILAVAFGSLGALAADDWSKQFARYGCGRFGESDAYQDAIKKVSADAGQYQTACLQDGGQFTWNYRKGLCTPNDPNDLFCRTECLVVGTGICRTPLFSTQFDLAEISGNGNGTPEPGEKLSIKVSLTNLKKSLQQAVTGELSSASPQITVPSRFLAWDDVGVGQTEGSTSSAEVHLAKEIPCGTKGALKLALKTAGGTQEITHGFRIGKFVGVPITAAADNLTTPVGANGVTLPLPIALPTTTTATGTRKIQFSLKLALKGTRQVRITLTSPDGVAAVLYNGNASNSLTYDNDLTAFFAQAKSIGEWKLVVKVTGQADQGSLEQYQLMVLPESFECQ